MLSHLTSCRGAVSSQIAASMGPIPVLQLLLMALRDWLHGGPLSPLGEAFYQIELLSVLLHKRAIRVAGTAAAAAGDGVTPEQRRAFERRVHAGKRFAAFNFCSMWAKGYQPEALLGLAAAVAVATGRGELVAAVLGCGASRLVHKHKHHGQTVADTAANPSEAVQLTLNMQPPNAPPFGVSYRRYGDAAGAHEVRQSQPAWSLTLTGRQLLGEAPVHTLPTLGGGAPVDAPASSWFLEHGVFPGSERVAIMGRLATGVLGDMSTLAEVIRDLPSSFTPADADLARARFIGNAALAELSEEMVHEAGIAYANAKLQLEQLAQRPEFQHQPASALAASLLHVASHASTTISTSSLHNSLQQRNVTPAGCAGTAASAANTPWLLMAAVLTDVGLPSIANSKLFARGAPHAALEELQRALAQPAGSEERRKVAERMVVGLRLHKLGAAQAREVGASAATAAACMGLGGAADQLGHRHGAIVHVLKLMAEGLEGWIKFLGWCKRWADGMQQGQRSVSSLQDVVALINSNGGLNGHGLGAVTGRIGRFWGWVAAELPHVVGEVRQVLEDSRSGGADAADSEEGLRRAACAVNDALGDDADAELTRGCVRAMAASMQSEDGGKVIKWFAGKAGTCEADLEHLTELEDDADRATAEAEAKRLFGARAVLVKDLEKSQGGSNYFNGLGTTTQNRTGDRAGTVRTLQHHKEDAGVGGLKGKVSEQPLSYVTRNGKGVYQLTKKKINGAWVPLGEYTGTHSLPEILPLIIGYRGALKDNTQAAKLGHWLAKGAMESDDRAAEDYKAAGPKASWPVEVLAGFEEAMAEDG